MQEDKQFQDNKLGYQLTRAQQDAFNALVEAVDEMTDKMEERQSQERNSQERERESQERDSQERESQESQVRPKSQERTKSQKVTELGNTKQSRKSRRAR